MGEEGWRRHFLMATLLYDGRMVETMSLGYKHTAGPFGPAAPSARSIYDYWPFPKKTWYTYM